MKREICCTKCAEEWRRIMPVKYPELNADGEGMHHVVGVARVDCRCDGCGSDLPVGSAATAVSIYSACAPYFEWEGEYIAAPTADTGQRCENATCDDAPDAE